MMEKAQIGTGSNVSGPWKDGTKLPKDPQVAREINFLASNINTAIELIKALADRLLPVMSAEIVDDNEVKEEKTPLCSLAADIQNLGEKANCISKVISQITHNLEL